MKLIINELSVFTQGDKQNRAIIFLHGFPFDHTAWHEQINQLSSEYYCVSYDIRGLGESSVGDGQFTMDSFVDDLENLMSEMKLDKAILCAHSMGGYISLRALEKMQDKFFAAILLDTVSTADANEGKLKRAAAIKRINTQGLAPFVEDFINLCYGDLYKQKHPQEVEKRVQKSASFNPIGVKGCLLAMLSRTDTTQFLSEIKIPTLLLCGENDTLTTPLAMMEMSKQIGNSEFVVIKNSGHMSAVENPTEVNSAIKSFLAKI